ncbi:hypothetical protein [Kribbella albertanoniae]|uniref:Uncharacterized protein n=1 Tax=Kribbella albertanoniae TaxID=1266829 RepID=A0A4R4PMR4_9ACTN|nr:hypothetical protein [Kribbella albertanoniae]TDC23354.1 hypothetical protein E1261_28655 [Kribbella albertanoniae]
MATGEHLTDALTGRHVGPLSHDERHELERVKGYLQSLGSCYRELSERQADVQRRDALRAEAHRCDDAVQRLAVMSPAERQDILQAVPGRVQALRAELDA